MDIQTGQRAKHCGKKRSSSSIYHLDASCLSSEIDGLRWSCAAHNTYHFRCAFSCFRLSFSAFLSIIGIPKSFVGLGFGDGWERPPPHDPELVFTAFTLGISFLVVFFAKAGKFLSEILGLALATNGDWLRRFWALLALELAAEPFNEGNDDVDGVLWVFSKYVGLKLRFPWKLLTVTEGLG